MYKLNCGVFDGGIYIYIAETQPQPQPANKQLSRHAKVHC